MLQRFCKSDQLGLLQPNCRWQTLNFAFIEHKSILYYVHVFLENSSIFSDYFFFNRNFWYYLDNHLFKKTSQFKNLWWVILDYLKAHFSRVYIKVYKDVFCITSILTTLKKVHSRSSPGGHFSVYFGLSSNILIYFLRTGWFLMKICIYILDNTVMVSPFAWC